jgi:hypothetical protein
MDTIHDGASRQRPNILPRLAIHGSAGLVAIIGAGLVGHMMMASEDPRPMEAAPATAQIYVLPDAAQPDMAPSPGTAAPATAAGTDAAPQPVAEAPIPPKPVAKPAIKAAAKSCEGGDCPSWESIVNKALATGPTTQSRPAPIQASAPREALPFDPASSAAPMTAEFTANEPRVIEREGPNNVGRGNRRHAEQQAGRQSDALERDGGFGRRHPAGPYAARGSAELVP